MTTADTYVIGSPREPTRSRSRWRGTVGRVGPLGAGHQTALVAGAVLILVSVIGPLLIDEDPIRGDSDAFLSPGSAGHLLGTDEGGRDLLVRVLIGMRTTIFTSIAVLALSVVIGAIVGLVAGAAGGWLDWALMRVTEVFLALPGTLLAIAFVAAFGPGLRNTLIAVALVWWPWYARIVRNEVWALSTRPHVDAARLSGVGGARRARRHMLPGVAAPLLVTASLDFGAVVAVLAALSFFGLGAPPPEPELGAMTARGLSYLLEYWWVPLVPAMAVALLAFVANLCGEVARRALEERS